MPKEKPRFGESGSDLQSILTGLDLNNPGLMANVILLGEQGHTISGNGFVSVDPISQNLKSNQDTGATYIPLSDFLDLGASPTLIEWVQGYNPDKEVLAQFQIGERKLRATLRKPAIDI